MEAFNAAWVAIGETGQDYAIALLSAAIVIVPFMITMKFVKAIMRTF